MWRLVPFLSKVRPYDDDRERFCFGRVWEGRVAAFRLRRILRSMTICRTRQNRADGQHVERPLQRLHRHGYRQLFVVVLLPGIGALQHRFDHHGVVFLRPHQVVVELLVFLFGDFRQNAALEQPHQPVTR